MDEFALARVEQQRLDLEANVTKLKKSLRHWQALEIDYQGLSEEYIGRPERTSKDQLLKIAREYGADVVDEKELRELINYDKGVPRKPEQIINLLSKRTEYADRNIETIKKQLIEAERKRNALLLSEQPEFRDDAGLPLTEITEELDEEGRVVSSKVQRSDEAAPQLMDVLKKAGVKGLEQEGREIVVKDGLLDENTLTAPLLLATNPDSHEITDPSRHTPNVDSSKDSGGVPTSVSLQHQPFTEATTNPRATHVAGESPEDAALRAEMLQYHEGLGEVGAIVAELDLEEGDVSMDDADDDLSFDSDYDEDEDLEEESDDEKGMSRSSLQSQAYLRKMKQLEKKHGITGMSNLGPKPDLPSEVTSQIDRPRPAEAARKAALARSEAAAISESTPQNIEDKLKKSKMKKVSFANTLDITPEDKLDRRKATSMPSGPAVLNTKPLKESIVERQGKESVDNSVAPAAKKVSRFKAARSDIPQTPMFTPEASEASSSVPNADGRTGREGKIYEPNIIERPAALEKSPPAPGGDQYGIDEEMHQREIAAEYRTLHNRMIQRQGGFVHEGEANNWGNATAPLPVEDDAGKVRKVSRFKAARMK